MGWSLEKRVYLLSSLNRQVIEYTSAQKTFCSPQQPERVQCVNWLLYNHITERSVGVWLRQHLAAVCTYRRHAPRVTHSQQCSTKFVVTELPAGAHCDVKTLHQQFNL